MIIQTWCLVKGHLTMLWLTQYGLDFSKFIIFRKTIRNAVRPLPLVTLLDLQASCVSPLLVE